MNYMFITIVSGLLVGFSAGLLSLFGQWLWTRHSRKRELRASDLRGRGGQGPYSVSPYSDAELAEMHDNRADSPRVLRNSDLLAKMLRQVDEAKRDEELPPGIVRSGGGLWREVAGGRFLEAWPECDQLALERASGLRQVDEKVAANLTPGAVVSVTKAELEAIRKATDVLNRDSTVFAEPIPHARDPFAAWDGKRFVPVDPAQQGAGQARADLAVYARADTVGRHVMLTQAVAQMEADGVMKPGSLDQVLRRDWGYDPLVTAVTVDATPKQGGQSDQFASGTWRGTGGARSDMPQTHIDSSLPRDQLQPAMPQEWVDRVTEAGLVATNPVDVRRQAAEAGIRFNSQTGRGERIRETGPEAKWVP